jgi:hypothetical protein
MALITAALRSPRYRRHTSVEELDREAARLAQLQQIHDAQVVEVRRFKSPPVDEALQTMRTTRSIKEESEVQNTLDELMKGETAYLSELRALHHFCNDGLQVRLTPAGTRLVRLAPL